MKSKQVRQITDKKKSVNKEIVDAVLTESELAEIRLRNQALVNAKMTLIMLQESLQLFTMSLVKTHGLPEDVLFDLQLETGEFKRRG